MYVNNNFGNFFTIFILFINIGYLILFLYFSVSFDFLRFWRYNIVYFIGDDIKMSDIFTLKTVPLTPELGMALKNFRIEKKVTAKNITEKFKKSSSYITKLEKGDIKKIEGDFLVELCNYISGSEDGLSEFLNRSSHNYKEYSNETKFIIMNIDDLLLEHTIPENLISEIKKYISSHKLTISQLVETVNSNKDILDRDDYETLPLNIWYDKNFDIDNAAIKLSIPPIYIENLLKQELQTIHRVIAEAILYSLYKLGKEDTPHYLAHDKLELYHILPARSVIRVTPDNVENIFGGLEPDTANALKEVTSGLKLITTLTKAYGAKRIKQISNNLEEDLGFCFAYMSIDIVELEKKDKEKKQQFLDELKSLVEKYSQEDTGIDIYE